MMQFILLNVVAPGIIGFITGLLGFIVADICRERANRRARKQRMGGDT